LFPETLGIAKEGFVMKLHIPYEKAGRGQGSKYPRLIHAPVSVDSYHFLNSIAEQEKVSLSAVVRYSIDLLKKKASRKGQK